MEFIVNVRDGAQLYREGFKNKIIYLPKEVAKHFKKDDRVKVTIVKV